MTSTCDNIPDLSHVHKNSKDSELGNSVAKVKGALGY